MRCNGQDRYSILVAQEGVGRRPGGSGKGFRRLKVHKQLPIMRGALPAHQAKHAISSSLELHTKAA